MKDKAPYGVDDFQVQATGHRFCAGDEIAEDVWDAADVQIQKGANSAVLLTNVLVIDTVESVVEPEDDWSSWLGARSSAQEAWRLTVR